MKTAAFALLNLLAIAAILAVPTASRAHEPAKSCENEKAIELKDGSPVEGFSLSIRVVQKDFASQEKQPRHLLLGKAIYLEVEVVNASEEDLFFVETNRELDIRIVMLDSKGRPVPRTPDGERLLKMQNDPMSQISRRVAKRLSPGESLRYEFDLRGWFDLSRPGTYSVQATYDVFKKPGPGLADLRSNVAVFELEQATPPACQ